MSSIKRLLVSILIVTVLLCKCVYCKTVELTVCNLIDPSATDMRSRVEAAVIQRFLEDHPNVRIKKETNLRMGNNTMDVVPLMQIAGDISPDVIYVNFRFSETYIQKGFLKPLDEYMSSISREELARRVPAAVREVCYREGPDGKKHWYALPVGRYVRVLTYRRDLFAKAGLDPDRPPRTWSEFEQYSRKLCNSKTGARGMVFVSGGDSSWDFINLVWSRGGEVIVKNKKGEWEPQFNTQEMVDALYFYVKMNCKRWKGSDGKYYRGVAHRETIIDVMKPGDPSAMMFDYLDDRMKLSQHEVLGFAPIPYPDKIGRSSSEINCPMLGIFAGVKDPEVAKAAFDYLAFQDSDKANRIRVKMYIQRGAGKVLNPELLERFGYTDYLKQMDKGWVSVYKDALVNGKPEPYGKNCSVVYHELSRPLEQAINDRIVLAALDRGDERAVKDRLREILNRAQIVTSERMFGKLQPEVKRFRHNLTVLFLVVTAAGFFLASLYLFKSFKNSAPPQMPGQKKKIYAYLLLLPAVTSIIVWQYYPLLRGTIIAFQDYNVMGKSQFVGVDNFSNLLFDPNFWHSVYVTLLYTALYMAFAFVSPIVLALLLSEIPRGKIFFRTMFYLPAVLSGLVVIFLWKSFYNPTGLLNTLFSYIGINMNSSWLDVPSLAMIAVMLPVVWAGMGPGCLIYLAALKTIPEELYEAAEVDGAGIRRKIFNITLPSIRMLIMINVVGAFTGAFMSSEMIFAMTGGGPYTPNGATEVVGLQLFYTAFLYLKFGLANAMAWVLGFMLIGFTMMQLRVLSRVEFKGGR